MAVCNPDWFDIEFVKKVLDSDVNLKSEKHIFDSKVEPAVKNGENYSSHLYRLNVTFRHGSIIQNNNYIVKQLLDPNTSAGKNLLVLNVFEKEITMYSKILVEVGKMLESIGMSPFIGPRLIYWQQEPVQLLVLEDLKDLGFSSPDRRKGLKSKECEVVLSKLALLHATSMILNKKNPDFRNIFNKGGFFENMPDYLSQYYVNAILQSIDAMKDLPECKKYTDAFKKYSENMVSRGIELLRPIPTGVEDYNVLNHGDCWLNNVLFKYSEGSPIDVAFVDFQMSTFGNPGLDLNYFFFSSPTMETRREFRETLLQKYVNIVADVLTKHDYDGLIPTMADLKRKLLECKDIAIMTPGIMLPIVKLNQQASETIDTESLMRSNETKTGSDLYNNPVFLEEFNDAVKFLSEIGYITEDKI